MVTVPHVGHTKESLTHVQVHMNTNTYCKKLVGNVQIRREFHASYISSPAANVLA